MQRFILNIKSQDDAKINNENICCYVVDEKTSSYIPSTDKLVLASGEDASSLCKNKNLDGVLYELDVTQPVKRQVASVVEQMGAKKFLGIICPLRRHELMLASECEPDFIALKVTEENKAQALDIIKWYNELFLIQLAVVVEDKISDYEVFDADFVLLNSDFLKEISC